MRFLKAFGMGKVENGQVTLPLSEAFRSPGRALLQAVTQSLRLIHPCGFVPLLLVSKTGALATQTWCVPACWADRVAGDAGAGASLLWTGQLINVNITLTFYLQLMLGLLLELLLSSTCTGLF